MDMHDAFFWSLRSSTFVTSPKSKNANAIYTQFIISRQTHHAVMICKYCCDMLVKCSIRLPEPLLPFGATFSIENLDFVLWSVILLLPLLFEEFRRKLSSSPALFEDEDEVNEECEVDGVVVDTGGSKVLYKQIYLKKGFRLKLMQIIRFDG